jgi:hypothetical protein
MPYEGEYASSLSLGRIVNSRAVQALKSRLKTLTGTHRPSIGTGDLLRFERMPSCNWMPDFVVAIDGSWLQVPMENGFPGAELGYISMAAVLLKLREMTGLDQHRPFDPVLFNATRETSAAAMVIPGCNVILDDDSSALQSMRKALFQGLSDSKLDQSGESLLETYEALLALKPPSDTKCPYGPLGQCRATELGYQPRPGQYSCTCSSGRMLYSTDALRVHEALRLDGPSGEMYGELTQLVERLAIVNLLRYFEAKNNLALLSRVALVVDGPLAVFGHPAWLSAAIRQELCRINAKFRAATRGKDLLIVGIEKSGQFVEHLIRLDTNANGTPDAIERGSYALLTDNYIKKRIIYSDSTRPYGEATYFGRKLFLKTETGARVVAELPILNDPLAADSYGPIGDYPRLPDCLGTLDKLVMRRYPDALVPIVAAHAEAAIPLVMGQRVLRDLAETLRATS